MSDRTRILLCSMPDSAMAFKRIGDMPNLGLPSIAATVPETDVRILDLQVVFHNVKQYVLDELLSFRPDIVGFSAMSFQFDTAKLLAREVKKFDAETKVILGGYHASMAYREFSEADAALFDFLVRGEGESVFSALVERVAAGESDFSSLPGVSWYGSGWNHNPPGQLISLSKVPLPRRSARVLHSFFLFGKRIETVETSRGCTMPCNFCSISRMYGPSFRTYPVERVIEDIRISLSRGAEMIFFVDDNITLDVERFKNLCTEIVREGLNSVEYITQVSVTGMASDPELVKLMREAGFTVVFLGIESVSAKNLKEMRKGDIRKAAEAAVDMCRKGNIAVIGGFIAGLPDDGPAEVKNVFREAVRLGVDHVIVQCVTPYPNTGLRERLIAEGLVVNKEDYSRYNGYICNVRTRKMSVERLNRILNLENIKLYFNPGFIKRNRLLKRDDSWRWRGRVFINSLEHFPALIKNRLFFSRHTL